MRHIVLLLVTALSLSACMAPVKQVSHSDATPVPENAAPAPFRLSNIVFRLPVGKQIGNYGSESMNFCFSTYEAERNQLTSNVDKDSARKAFYQTMAGLGYDVTGSDEFLFEEEADDDWLRTEFKVGAKITDARMDACHQEPGLLSSVINNSYGDKGKLYIQVEWSVYDSLRRTTVYKTTTEGYVDRKRANYEGMALMFNDAFSMATHNLAADAAFHDLIVKGRRPPRDQWQQQKKDHTEARRKFEPQEAVHLAQTKPATKTVNMEEARKVAVMIEADSSHGSGFFITREGHILTNAHVVGEALRVRVQSADKEEKMIAEVLRRDPARDVAVLKLEEIPTDLHIHTRAIETAWPAIGSEAYAVGAPLSKKLQDTVTKGIISAHRRNFSLMGTRQNLIQGDIEIHAGNSGGPLLDQYGNIIAISVAGYGADSGIGLNLFVPIAEALDRLDIALPR